MGIQRNAISYQRVSTTRQADKGHSMSTQASLIRSYCTSKRYQLAATYEDKGRSGRTTKQRPGLEKAIAESCETGGVLVVYSISRLARSIVDASRILQRLKDNGADLAIVDSDISTVGPYGKLVFSIMTAMAEFESDLIGERVRASLQRIKKERGQTRQGSQPLGWAIDEAGKKVKVVEEQEVLAKVRRAKRGTSYGKAAVALNNAGVPTIRQLRGQKLPQHGWQAASVHRVLNR